MPEKSALTKKGQPQQSVHAPESEPEVKPPELASSPCMMEEFSEYFFPDTAAESPDPPKKTQRRPKSS